VIDNRWVVSIDRATGEHRLAVQLPNDFNGSNNGELLSEPGGTLLYAGDGAISRIDPEAHTITPVLSGAPLVTPLGLAFAPNGDLWIADYNAGAVFRWNEVPGIAPVASGDLLVGPTRVRQLADGDLLVLRATTGQRPVRVDPATGDQSFYFDVLGSMTSAAIASNGDLIYANTTSSTGGAIWRSTSPNAASSQLLAVGQFEKVGNAGNLALDGDDHVLIAGVDREFTDGVETDSDAGVFELDPGDSSVRVVSRRPPNGGIATSADGRLFLANQAGTGFNLREIDPYAGETRRAAADPLFTRPFDAAVEADGHVVVLNGIPNGTPSVLRVDPDTGDTDLLSPTDELIDPRRSRSHRAGRSSSPTSRWGSCASIRRAASRPCSRTATTSRSSTISRSRRAARSSPRSRPASTSGASIP
jgi:streptogramin lyase